MFSFRLGSIPVRVHFMFFLTVAFFGLQGTSPQQLVAWVAVAFVGVLLHELGHALVGRRFGLIPQIDLIAFGGLTSWTATRPVKLTTGRRIAISVAGPLVSVFLGVATLVGVLLVPPPTPPLSKLLEMVIEVNLIWGGFNLLPIIPMDGGNILLALLQKVTHGRGEAPARVVSLVIASALALVWFKWRHDAFSALFVGLFFVAPHVRWFQERNQAATPNDASAPPF